MKAKKVIGTPEDRDQLLMDLYKDREFWIFWNGVEYFNQQVQDIHNQWINGYGPNTTSWGNNLIVEQTCWELDNGFL